MSAESARARAIACPAGLRRSIVIERLLRDWTCHHSDVSFSRYRQRRSGSPWPGGSTLTTSAPNSARIFAQNGPAISAPS